MANEMRDLERGLLHRATYDEAKSRLFGLVGLSGVEFHESAYDHDFSLTREYPAQDGPYEALLDRVRVSYDENRTSAYESLLVRTSHRAIKGSIATYFCGTKLGITVLAGVVRYAWIDSMIPFCNSKIPEAESMRVMTYGERRDFIDWEHEYDLRHTLTEEALEIVLNEIWKIAE